MPQRQYFGPSTKGRHPRTLQEAFGPYETGPIIDPEPAAYGWPWWVAVVACGVSAAVISAFT